MHPLDVLRDELLQSSNPTETLRLADTYLSQFEDMGDRFILPLQNRKLKPILDYYYRDLNGWLKFVCSIRDEYLRSTPAKGDLQEFYRNLGLRKVQGERRKRLNAATDMAIKLGKIAPDAASKQRYRQKCVKEWGIERDALLAEHRRLTKGNRLSSDEQSILLAAFWAEIDARINRGDIPEP